MEAYNKLQDHIEKLRVLNYVARSGSITKAASLLHITQAAASHSIRVLEGALDVKLLHREARGIRLTDSGKVLFEFSQKLLADIQTAEALTLNPYQKDAGMLRVGTHETLAIHVWPPFLQQFSHRHPKVSVSLISGRVDQLIQGLRNREYQIVMTVEPLPHRDIESHKIYPGVMGLFVGSVANTKHHPSLSRRTLSLAQANELSILTDASAHIRQNLPIPTFLLDQGFRLDRFYELNSFEAAMRLAMTGAGIAVVPERNAAGYVKSGQLRPIQIKELNTKTFGAHHICASRLRSTDGDLPLVNIFFEELLTYCKKSVR